MTELFNDLKEGLEEAKKYNEGEDTGAYVVGKQELLPCPFCGNTKIRDDQYIRDGKQVECSGCGASTQAYNPSANKKATHLWNTRAKTQREIELEEALSECLMFADKMADDYGKLSDHLDRKNLATPSPLIVIREMYNQLVTTSEKALKATKEG